MIHTAYQERQKHLASLLKKVRLQEVPRKVLAERFGAEPLVKAESRVQLMIMEAMVPDRQPPLSLVVIGGWSTNGCNNSVLACPLPKGRCYLPASPASSWREVAALPAPRATSSAVLLDDRVYTIGGWDGRTATQSVFVYNAATNSWSIGPTMTTGRKWPGVAALGGRLYVAGGLSAPNCTRLASVEALDPREGVWRPVATMATRRSALGAAALGDKLYAVGGFDGLNVLNVTERYDPAADRWQAVESMSTQRSGAGVAALGDALYVAGGLGGGAAAAACWPQRSVERYRAGRGWGAAPAMALARYNVAAAAHGGRLYVAGGRTDRQYVAAVAALEPAAGVWRELPALPAGRDVAAAVVVPWPRPPDA